MGKFSYFAYGSNMLTPRLVSRCESAVFTTVASLERHRLEFSKKSIDGSGKATIVSDEDAQGPVFGAVFQISNAELENLDAFEGKDYDRRPCTVICSQTGREIDTWTYYAKELHSGLVAYDWYLALVIAGLCEHDIDKDYGSAIRAFPYQVDTDHGRKTRRAAIEAFDRVGIGDYKALLSKPGIR